MKLTQIFLSPNGRMNRPQYWTGASVVLAIVVLPSVLSAVVGRENYALHFRAFGQSITAISVAMLYPGVCLYSKRLHDIGLSGWFQLILYAITLGVSIYFLAVMVPIMMNVLTEHARDGLAQSAAVQAVAKIPALRYVGYAATGLEVLLIAGLGLIPGQARGNKYGDAPGAENLATVFR